MKLIVYLTLLVVAVQATPYYIPPGFVNAEIQEEFLKKSEGKIASGIKAGKGEYPEFCFLSIKFFEKSMSCGCWIYEKQYVVTSARCVMDCSEGIAANVTVTIPGISGKDGIFKVEKIYVPDAANLGTSGLTAYVPSTIHTTIEANNIAIIKLASIIPQAKLGIGKEANRGKYAVISDADAASFALRMKDYKFRACGVGIINNNRDAPTGVICTEVNFITDPLLCKEPYGDAAATPFPIPAYQYCLQWPDRENNACIGDFGGPVYAYRLDVRGAIDINSQLVVCTLVGSPNVRKNAPCLDGHITFCTVASGARGATAMGPTAWLDSILNPLPTSLETTTEYHP